MHTLMGVLTCVLVDATNSELCGLRRAQAETLITHKKSNVTLHTTICLPAPLQWPSDQLEVDLAGWAGCGTLPSRLANYHTLYPLEEVSGLLRPLRELPHPFEEVRE